MQSMVVVFFPLNGSLEKETSFWPLSYKAVFYFSWWSVMSNKLTFSLDLRHRLDDHSYSSHFSTPSQHQRPWEFLFLLGTVFLLPPFSHFLPGLCPLSFLLLPSPNWLFSTECLNKMVSTHESQAFFLLLLFSNMVHKGSPLPITTNLCQENGLGGKIICCQG